MTCTDSGSLDHSFELRQRQYAQNMSVVVGGEPGFLLPQISLS